MFYFVHFVHMRVITTTAARKNISDLVNLVKLGGETIGIGRRRSIDVLLIPFPTTYNPDLDDITNINAVSRSFAFLEDEPELYTRADVKKIYG